MLGVLGVAVFALITDQLLPAESAASEVQANANAEVAADVTAEEGVSGHSGPTLSERFSRYAPASEADQNTITEAFAPLRATGPATGPTRTTLDTPEAGIKLSAILRRDDENIAVINGRPLREGQSFDGFEILSIDGEQVHVRTAVGAITLELERPSLQSD